MRYFGYIGYEVSTEVKAGDWREVMTERPYYGDVNRNGRRLQNGTGPNDDVTISNEISIVADEFAFENFHSMRYATFMGTKWKITSIDVQRPRLILTLGGVYNV